MKKMGNLQNGQLLALQIPKDVIMFPQSDGLWAVVNVFARTALGVDVKGLSLIRDFERMQDNQLSEKYQQEIFQFWEIEQFPNAKGLVVNPTWFDSCAEKWPPPQNAHAAEFLKMLESKSILVRDLNAYRGRFGPKQSLMDFEHFGNFHQRLGQALLLKERQNPSAWWVRQKFTDDLKDLRQNLYRGVQLYHLKRFFKERLSRGKTVLDLGCGVGFYANLMAQSGASVLGLDPNPDYIELAKSNATPNATFRTVRAEALSQLSDIANGTFDFVFMIDALLFYFVSPENAAPLPLEPLLKEIKRVLKPGGRFVSVEPHYTFWLTPWFGDEERPFTVLSEYHQKYYQVTASTAQLIQQFAKGGFVVKWMEELTPEPEFEKVDKRAFHFASQFPMWQLYELMPESKSS